MIPSRAALVVVVVVVAVTLGSVVVVPARADRLERHLAGQARVMVRTEHAPVVVDGERYRLVTARAPLVAAVQQKGAGAPQQVVLYVVRLGTAAEPPEGATPLLVTVGGKQHIFPNRPPLERERRAETPGSTYVASYPIRYPVGRVPPGELHVRVSLRRADRGGLAGVRLVVEPIGDDQPAPHNRLSARRRKPPAPRAPAGEEPKTPPPVVAADEPLRLVEDVPAERQPDAGPAAPAPPPPPPEERLPEGRVTMTLDNRMSDVFRLDAAELVIDGVPVDVPALPRGAAQTPLFDGELAAGPHTVEVGLRYGGSGGMLFSYLDAYVFHVSGVHRIVVEDGKRVDVRIEAYEDGGFLTEIVDRPAIRIRSTTTKP